MRILNICDEFAKDLSFLFNPSKSNNVVYANLLCLHLKWNSMTTETCLLAWSTSRDACWLNADLVMIGTSWFYSHSSHMCAKFPHVSTAVKYAVSPSLYTSMCLACNYETASNSCEFFYVAWKESYQLPHITHFFLSSKFASDCEWLTCMCAPVYKLLELNSQSLQTAPISAWTYVLTIYLQTVALIWLELNDSFICNLWQVKSVHGINLCWRSQSMLHTAGHTCSSVIRSKWVIMNASHLHLFIGQSMWANSKCWIQIPCYSGGVTPPLCSHL